MKNSRGRSATGDRRPGRGRVPGTIALLNPFRAAGQILNGFHCACNRTLNRVSLDELPCALSHLGKPIGIGCELLKFARERIDIAAWEDAPGDTFFYEVWSTADSVADDCREPTGHRLVHNQSPRFTVVRRQHNAIRRGIG